MDVVTIVSTAIAVSLVSLTSRYRSNAKIIALEFFFSALATFILLDLEGYKFTGGQWVFGTRVIILFWAVRETRKLRSGHWLIAFVMTLGMFLNLGAYFEYAIKSYGIFDYYYTISARIVIVIQLIYLVGIGYVGQCAGRIWLVSVRWWRANCLSRYRSKIIGRG